jgi:hypothetical protein
MDLHLSSDDVMGTNLVQHHPSNFGVPGFGTNPFALQIGPKIY